MTNDFSNRETRRVLRTMLGNMYPAQMVTLHKDRELRNSDVSDWIEQTLRQECTLVLKRLEKYENKILERYGHLPTMAEKLEIYHEIWENWDGLEPCPFTRARTLKNYFDKCIPEEVKNRIRRHEALER